MKGYTEKELKYIDDYKEFIENRTLIGVLQDMGAKLPQNSVYKMATLIAYTMYGVEAFGMGIVNKGPSRSKVRANNGEVIYIITVNIALNGQYSKTSATPVWPLIGRARATMVPHRLKEAVRNWLSDFFAKNIGLQFKKVWVEIVNHLISTSQF